MRVGSAPEPPSPAAPPTGGPHGHDLVTGGQAGFRPASLATYQLLVLGSTGWLDVLFAPVLPALISLALTRPRAPLTMEGIVMTVISTEKDLDALTFTVTCEFPAPLERV